MSPRFSKFLLVFISLGLTAFVFMNTYEVVFNKDIAIAHSVRQYAAQDQIDAIIKQFDLKPEAGREQHNAPYSGLRNIQIVALGANLYLEEKRVINGLWYQRPNLGHIIGLNKDNNDIVVDYLIYTNSSWQTIPFPDQIEPGMDVKLFHDGHAVSMFKVAEKKVLPLHTTFVASKSEKRQIILMIEDPKNNQYYAYSLVLKD